MPLDLNQFNHESLTAKIKTLRPGQAFVTNDGILVRRRPNSSGYDCGVGRGGRAQRRMNSPEEAADDMLTTSARYENPQALGGATRFEDADKAIESVRRGEATPTGPSPAVKALRAVARGAGLGSYRTRAQRARDELARGNVAQAVRQMEAIIEHAGNNGKSRDVERAQAALAAIREHHEYEPGVPQLNKTKIEIRTEGVEHFVYQDGRPVTSGMTRTEAEARRAFLSRKAAREEDIQEIESEVAGKPSLVKRAEEVEAA